jgi:hypothetical protein
MNTFKNILIILILVLGRYPLSKLAMPLFSKLFMGYPQLENTVLYEGTVEVKGEDDCDKPSCPSLNYYVANTSGSHEIYWIKSPGFKEQKILLEKSHARCNRQILV